MYVCTKTGRRIRAIFGGMDDDNSGYVTRKELREGLIELGVPDTQDVDGTFFDCLNMYPLKSL
eukprot:COSAG06_NODE_167_length_21546_cov_35.001352_15_plen_63_part_00